MGEIEDLAIAVVGGGAAGVGIGAVLSDLGIEDFALLEREGVGASFEQWPEEMRFITPSFPANPFSCRDLNAVTIDTSPGFGLNREHPSGEEYAEYLQGVVDLYDLPVRTGVEVYEVVPGDQWFTLETSDGPIRTRFVVWAAGTLQYPNLDPFPGAEHGIHNAGLDSWQGFAEECVDDDVIVIGGYESGIDAALNLAKNGMSVSVLDGDGPWQYRGPDPSAVLSPHTAQRLDEALQRDAPIDLVDGSRVEGIERTNGSHEVLTTDGQCFRTRNRPVLATGFDGSLGLADEYFAFEDGHPVLTDRDESTETPGLFLVGEQVYHNGQEFCFIYKYRQRFAVVVDAIAERLGIDRSPLEAYRDADMFLEDLSCCDPDICDC